MALFLYPKQGGDRMADNFGLKIGVEGEKEFKKALAEINQNFKVLGSEMKLVSSQFDKNDKSVDALTARNQVLSKEIDEQKNKIDLLKQALDNASSSFGENDRRTQQWQIKLNNAQATLNDLEKELKDNNDTLDKTADELNHIFQTTISLRNRSKLSLTHAFFFHINKLIFNATLLEEAFCFLCIITFLSSKNLDIGVLSFKYSRQTH